MFRKYVLEYLQNKNSVMFITAIIFIVGIMSYFNDCAVAAACIISAGMILLLILNIIPVKYVIFWIIVFYAGFFNAGLKTINYDELSKLAPLKADITGQIVSIPNIAILPLSFLYAISSNNIANNSKAIANTFKSV